MAIRARTSVKIGAAVSAKVDERRGNMRHNISISEGKFNDSTHQCHGESQSSCKKALRPDPSFYNWSTCLLIVFCRASEKSFGQQADYKTCIENRIMRHKKQDKTQWIMTRNVYIDSIYVTYDVLIRSTPHLCVSLRRLKRSKCQRKSSL